VCKGEGFALIGDNISECIRFMNEEGLAWDALTGFRARPNEENPSRDQHGNADIWTYMWSPTLDRNPDSYLVFPRYRHNEVDQAFWDNGTWPGPSVPYVGIGYGVLDREFLMLHPTVHHFAIVRWKSPISGHVSFSGWFYPHQDAGDGIRWYVEHKHESTVTTLAEGTLNSGDPEYAKRATFGLSSLEVSEGDFIYFVVDARATHAYDNTLFNVTLVGPEAID